MVMQLPQEIKAILMGIVQDKMAEAQALAIPAPPTLEAAKEMVTGQAKAMAGAGASAVKSTGSTNSGSGPTTDSVQPKTEPALEAKPAEPEEPPAPVIPAPAESAVKDVPKPEPIPPKAPEKFIPEIDIIIPESLSDKAEKIVQDMIKAIMKMKQIKDSGSSISLVGISDYTKDFGGGYTANGWKKAELKADPPVSCSRGLYIEDDVFDTTDENPTSTDHDDYCLIPSIPSSTVRYGLGRKKEAKGTFAVSLASTFMSDIDNVSVNMKVELKKGKYILTEDALDATESEDDE